MVSRGVHVPSRRPSLYVVVAVEGQKFVKRLGRQGAICFSREKISCFSGVDVSLIRFYGSSLASAHRVSIQKVERKAKRGPYEADSMIRLKSLSRRTSSICRFCVL